MTSVASAGDAPVGGLTPFTKLTKASVEALRYRGEDVEKSLTRNAIKEASLHEAVWCCSCVDVCSAKVAALSATSCAQAVCRYHARARLSKTIGMQWSL